MELRVVHPVHDAGTATLGAWQASAVLYLRRRPGESGVEHMERTGPMFARKLQKHNQPQAM